MSSVTEAPAAAQTAGSAIPVTTPQQAYLNQSAQMNTWYDVANHTGAGFLHAMIGGRSSGGDRYNIEFQVAVDGGSAVSLPVSRELLDSTTFSSTQDEVRREINLLVRFSTSLRVAVRTDSNRTIRAKVYYSTE